MSFFGKNIRKIRSVKGMSQQVFAELFDLKRATLGAYEEGRSEPKIETLIKIANYFSITVDAILLNELTVNELLKFEETITTHGAILPAVKVGVSIPCIHSNVSVQYCLNYLDTSFIQTLPVLQLPLKGMDKQELRAYVIDTLEMATIDKGFFPNDIIVGKKISLTTLDSLASPLLVLAILENKIIFRRITIKNDQLIFVADHVGVQNEVYPISDLKELCEVNYVFYHRIPEAISLNTKVDEIQYEIGELKKSIQKIAL